MERFGVQKTVLFIATIIISAITFITEHNFGIAALCYLLGVIGCGIYSLTSIGLELIEKLDELIQQKQK